MHLHFHTSKFSRLQNARAFTLVELLVVIAIIASLSAISSPIIIKQIAKTRATQAISNAKDIHIGLRDYNNKFGSLPPALATSNQSLVPVFESKRIVDEKPFFVKGITSYGNTFMAGDGDITTGNILEANSNVFTYWAASATRGLDINASSANTPVLSTPQLIDNSTNIQTAEFYAADCGGQGVVLTVDGAASAYLVNTTATNAVSGTLVQQDGTSPYSRPLIVGSSSPQPLLASPPLTSP